MTSVVENTVYTTTKDFAHYNVWHYVQKGADLCVNKGQSWFSIAERKKERRSLGEQLISDCVWFSWKTDILEGAAMYTGSILHVYT